MSKPRRRVTVESDKGLETSSERNKRSVFERLGPGATSRSASRDYEASAQSVCRNWRKTGHCNFGSKCKFLHPQERSSKKYSERDDEDEDTRGRSYRRSESSASSYSGESASPSPPPEKKYRKSSKDKDSKIKSAVVVTRPSAEELTSDESDSTVEQQLLHRQRELQRELSRLDSEEVPEHHVGLSVLQQSSDSEADPQPASRSKSKEKKGKVHMIEDTPGKKKKKEKKKKVKAKYVKEMTPEEEKHKKPPEPKPLKHHSRSFSSDSNEDIFQDVPTTKKAQVVVKSKHKNKVMDLYSDLPVPKKTKREISPSPYESKEKTREYAEEYDKQVKTKSKKTYSPREEKKLKKSMSPKQEAAKYKQSVSPPYVEEKQSKHKKRSHSSKGRKMASPSRSPSPPSRYESPEPVYRRASPEIKAKRKEKRVRESQEIEEKHHSLSPKPKLKKSAVSKDKRNLYEEEERSKGKYQNVQKETTSRSKRSRESPEYEEESSRQQEASRDERSSRMTSSDRTRDSKNRGRSPSREVAEHRTSSSHTSRRPYSPAPSSRSGRAQSPQERPVRGHSRSDRDVSQQDDRSRPRVDERAMRLRELAENRIDPMERRRLERGDRYERDHVEREEVHQPHGRDWFTAKRALDQERWEQERFLHEAADNRYLQEMYQRERAREGRHLFQGYGHDGRDAERFPQDERRDRFQHDERAFNKDFRDAGRDAGSTERMSRRQDWEVRRIEDDRRRHMDPKREDTRKRPYEEELTRSPSIKRRRDNSPAPSHHSTASRGWDREAERDRSRGDWNREGQKIREGEKDFKNKAFDRNRSERSRDWDKKRMDPRESSKERREAVDDSHSLHSRGDQRDRKGQKTEDIPLSDWTDDDNDEMLIKPEEKNQSDNSRAKIPSRHSDERERKRRSPSHSSRSSKQSAREDKYREKEEKQKEKEEKYREKEDKYREKEEKHKEREDKYREKEDRPRDREDRPKDREERPRDREDRPRERDDRPRDREDRPRDREDRPKDREDRPRDREDRPRDREWEDKERGYSKQKEDRKKGEEQDSSEQRAPRSSKKEHEDKLEQEEERRMKVEKNDKEEEPKYEKSQEKGFDSRETKGEQREWERRMDSQNMDIPPEFAQMPFKIDSMPEPSMSSEEVDGNEAVVKGKKGKDKDLKYDEISSDDDIDELIEKADTEQDQEKPNPAVDPFDIDWSILCESKKPVQPASNSALKRFSAANVFEKIGISRAYAGKAIFQEVQNMCQQQLKDEGDSKPNGNQDEKIEDDIEGKVQKDLKFRNLVATFHAHTVSKEKDRKTLLSNIGAFRRALCARQDLTIRRQLCKLDKEHEGISLFSNPVLDHDLYKQSLQLFRQDSSHALGKKSQSPCSLLNVDAIAT